MKTTETRVKQNPTVTDGLPYRPDLIEPKWQARWAEQHVPTSPTSTGPSGRSTT